MATSARGPRDQRESLPSPAHGGESARRGRRGVVLLLAFLLALLPTLVAADALDDRVRAIAKQLRCPVCAGESVADSHAQVSVQMRGIIRQKLEAGESEAQIKQYFVERYGESILLEPEARGFTLGVWIAPVVAMIAGLAIVGAVLRSWSRRGPAVLSRQPATAGPLPAADDDRLERELARFQRPERGVRG